MTPHHKYQRDRRTVDRKLRKNPFSPSRTHTAELDVHSAPLLWEETTVHFPAHDLEADSDRHLDHLHDD